MNKLLYPRLAWQNLRKNAKFYLPYILTIMGCSGALYILLALAGAQDLPQRTRYAYLSTFTFIGAFVVAFFSIIFLFYTNSFLMKRRTRELGLWSVLGMEKRHIAKVLTYEMLYTAFFGIGGGILCGLLFQKLVTLLLYRVMRFDVPYGFYVSSFGIAATIEAFVAILLLCLLWNLRQIHAQNPVELLRTESTGEKEPKIRWGLTLLGLTSLGVGYAIALTTNNAMDALALYFVAVLLVIVGTYCLFTAVSIAVLKLMRKNKRYYYQTKHFIGVSGMLYRMKRNAVGLANICILSTMVLVMVSGTMALFLGTDDALNDRYPADVVITMHYDPLKQPAFQPERMYEEAISRAKKSGAELEREDSLSILTFGAGKSGDHFTTDRKKSVSGASSFTILTAEEYKNLSGETVALEANEVLLWGKGKLPRQTLTLDFSSQQNPSGEQMRFDIVGKNKLSNFPVSGVVESVWTDCYCVVVANDAVRDSLYAAQKLAYGDQASSMTYKVLLDIAGDEAKESACAAALQDLSDINLEDWGSWEYYTVESRSSNLEDFYTLNGGFFFLGIFLGLLFIMATVLIIYYKQISEGYEDARRFQIMQQVGLEKEEIRRLVNGQVRVVFFMPLLVAAIHMAFDFKLVTLLLTLFGLFNTTLTLWCTLGTLAAFMAIYGVVYVLTARVYYRIVS